MANFSGFDHMYIYEFRDLLYLYRTMQVKSCVLIYPISLPVHHMGTPQELVVKVLCLCGSTDQKLIFCLIRCPQLTKYTPTDWTLDRKFTVKRCTIYLMASDMIEEMLLQEGINKRKKWMKKDLKQFTPDVKCLCSFLIMI